MSPDPIRKFQRWQREARKAGIVLPEACALATVDSHGRPSVRFMLLKSAGERGFVFYTNTLSRKGAELNGNPNASLAFYWDPTGRQVRVEGRVRPVTKAEADAYWSERPRASQLASFASQQSAPLANRADLLATYRRLERSYHDQPIPRPAEWTGYRLVARSIEFWTRHEPRLHHRELFVRKRGGWKRCLLQP